MTNSAKCLIGVLFLSACNGSGGKTANCSCTEFPYPKGCENQCMVTDAVVVSVKSGAGTASIRLATGQTEEVPVSQLPPGTEKGSKIQTFMKKMPAGKSHMIVKMKTGGNAQSSKNPPNQ